MASKKTKRRRTRAQRAKNQNLRPVCPYCGSAAVCIDSAEIYRGHSYGWMWKCSTCPDVYVSCHKGTRKPLGRMANAELRAAKVAAHTAFDRLWKSGVMSRTDAYHWLTDALGLDTQAHIGEMDIELCGRVVEVCRE